jgi:hypothetical protein
MRRHSRAIRAYLEGQLRFWEDSRFYDFKLKSWTCHRQRDGPVRFDNCDKSQGSVYIVVIRALLLKQQQQGLFIWHICREL